MAQGSRDGTKMSSRNEKKEKNNDKTNSRQWHDMFKQINPFPSVYQKTWTVSQIQ